MEPPPYCANATASRSVASGMPRNSPGKVIFLPIMDGKWLRERIADIDAEIKKQEYNKANNPPEFGGLYDKRIATMVEMRRLLENY